MGRHLMVDRSNGGIISGNGIPIKNNMDLPCKQVGMMWLILVFH